MNKDGFYICINNKSPGMENTYSPRHEKPFDTHADALHELMTNEGMQKKCVDHKVFVIHSVAVGSVSSNQSYKVNKF